MAGGTPTFTTLTDIANTAQEFANDCTNTARFATDRMQRANRYIKIQDPAFPDDPTKRIWHPNMLAFYTPEQLVEIQEFYDEIVHQYDFWRAWVGSRDDGPKMQLFNVLPKLDQLVAAGLSQLITD